MSKTVRPSKVAFAENWVALCRRCGWKGPHRHLRPAGWDLMKGKFPPPECPVCGSGSVGIA